MAALVLNLGTTWRAVTSLTRLLLYPGKRTDTIWMSCPSLRTVVQSAPLSLNKQSWSAALSLHKQLCSLQPCPWTNGCAVCSPVPAQTVVQSAALSLHKQLCSLQPCPYTNSCAVCSPVPAQNAAPRRPEPSSRSRSICVPRATDKCVASNRGNGTSYTSNLFRAARNIKKYKPTKNAWTDCVNISAEQLYVMLS